MKSNPVKDWLNRARHIDKEIKTLLEEQDRTFAQCTSIVTSMRTVVVRSTGNQRHDEALTRMAGYEQQIKELVDKLIATKQEITRAVSKVDNTTYRVLLEMRYLRYETWEKIAVELHYSYRHVVAVLHPRALREIEKILGETKGNAKISHRIT